MLRRLITIIQIRHPLGNKVKYVAVNLLWPMKALVFSKIYQNLVSLDFARQ
jgi:hypothetical protein